jgi:hypothetical protein
VFVRACVRRTDARCHRCALLDELGIQRCRAIGMSFGA